MLFLVDVMDIVECTEIEECIEIENSKYKNNMTLAFTFKVVAMDTAQLS